MKNKWNNCNEEELETLSNEIGTLKIDGNRLRPNLDQEFGKIYVMKS